MADDGDRKRGESDLRFMMNVDRANGQVAQKSHMGVAERIEAAVLPDAMVRREPQSEMEKADGDR